ncbi:MULTISPECIES: single-stranded DNA-binding protein [unclassified Sutcliffiella]|uniref:single-stranded DNA-binding protein n=1 Tax=unclassified Sutcliffiella TaxID=2837532 RepID=UPI0030CD80DF
MINEVVLIGRMVKDPDLRYTKEGIPVASFRLAVNRSFKNHEGVIEADFVSCTAWRNLAKTTADYCRKGALVAVTGRIQTSRFEGKDGTTVFVTDIVVDNVRFLEKKREEKQEVPAASHSTVPPPPPPNPDNEPYTQTQGQTDSRTRPREWNQVQVPQDNQNASHQTQESQVSSYAQDHPNFMGRQPEKVEV